MPKQVSVTEGRQRLLEKASIAISDATDALQKLFDDLDEKRSNLEERFSATERYSMYEKACSALEEAIGTLDRAGVPPLRRLRQQVEVAVELP